jgi:hypothetical protein
MGHCDRHIALLCNADALALVVAHGRQVACGTLAV